LENLFMELMQASNNWANRPADQRFTSLPAMLDQAITMRHYSRAKIVASKALQAQPIKTEQGYDLLLSGQNGNPARITHWAFGQLAQRAGAPAGYLRTLPAPLAADNINYGLQVARTVEDIGVLVTRDPAKQGITLRAITGPNYGRVWNETILRSLVSHFGDGVSGRFHVPGIFGKRLEYVTKENTTLYASDRDMFVFLADEENRIELPNRRDGKTGSLARGFFMWNSEVGAQTYGIAYFLFDYVCGNRIVWGAEQYKEVRIRHTASAPERFIHEIAPALEAFADSSAKGINETLLQAQRMKLEKDVDVFLKNRFTSSQITGIQAAHMADEQRPIETLWDVVTGATAYARGLNHQDTRVAVEREAGKLLQLAAPSKARTGWVEIAA
jgi:hypothetical protein